MIQYAQMEARRLDEILCGITNVRAALIGDLCLDIYWLADMTRSQLSRETPHFPLPVIEERMSPGAGGNVAANLAALLPKKLYALGVVGRDWRGECLLKQLGARDIDTSRIFALQGRFTCAYCKPVRKGTADLAYEDPRIDFENFTPLETDAEDFLIDALDGVADDIDVLCVSDQFQFGCLTPRVREKILALSKDGLKVVADSRDRIALYRGVLLKPNELECARAADRTAASGLEGQISAAEALARKNDADVVMTLGDKGCAYVGKGAPAVYIPSKKVAPPVDTVGAGDCFLSAFSLSLAAGARPEEAAYLANLASGVIVKKIGTTGTASPEEIRERYRA